MNWAPRLNGFPRMPRKLKKRLKRYSWSWVVQIHNLIAWQSEPSHRLPDAALVDEDSTWSIAWPFLRSTDVKP